MARSAAKTRSRSLARTLVLGAAVLVGLAAAWVVVVGRGDRRR